MNMKLRLRVKKNTVKLPVTQTLIVFPGFLSAYIYVILPLVRLGNFPFLLARICLVPFQGFPLGNFPCNVYPLCLKLCFLISESRLTVYYGAQNVIFSADLFVLYLKFDWYVNCNKKDKNKNKTKKLVNSVFPSFLVIFCEFWELKFLVTQIFPNLLWKVKFSRVSNVFFPYLLLISFQEEETFDGLEDDKIAEKRLLFIWPPAYFKIR